MFAVGVYSLSSGCFVLGSLSSPGSPSWARGCDSLWIAGLGCRLLLPILLDVFLPAALMAGACW